MAWPVFFMLKGRRPVRPGGSRLSSTRWPLRLGGHQVSALCVSRPGRARKSRMSAATWAGFSRQEKWPQSRIVVARTAGMARRLASRSLWFDQSWSP